MDPPENGDVPEEKEIEPELFGFPPTTHLLTLSSSSMSSECQTEGVTNEVLVYVVGTAHISKASVDEVKDVIDKVKPGVVMVELCKARQSILFPKKEKAPSSGKMFQMWKSGHHNAFSLLYSYFLANMAEKLDIDPGAEFRAAGQAAIGIKASILLGDRPISITIKRLWGSLSFIEKTRLAGMLMFGNVAYRFESDEHCKNEIEKLKGSDGLTEAIMELGEAFPGVREILIDERDLYLAYQLKQCALKQSRRPSSRNIVAVIGMGHMDGLKTHWTKDISVQKVKELLTIPKPTIWYKRPSFVGAVGFGLVCTFWVIRKLKKK